jgi:hypothetical protein
VAGAIPVVLDDIYRRAVAELQSQGACSRKRPRREGHVPVWGDVTWDVRLDQPHDGKEDLLEARGTGGVYCNQDLQVLTRCDSCCVSCPGDPQVGRSRERIIETRDIPRRRLEMGPKETTQHALAD